jgi:hypothetical protein
VHDIGGFGIFLYLTARKAKGPQGNSDSPCPRSATLQGSDPEDEGTRHGDQPDGGDGEPPEQSCQRAGSARFGRRTWLDPSVGHVSLTLPPFLGCSLPLILYLLKICPGHVG